MKSLRAIAVLLVVAACVALAGAAFASKGSKPARQLPHSTRSNSRRRRRSLGHRHGQDPARRSERSRPAGTAVFGGQLRIHWRQRGRPGRRACPGTRGPCRPGHEHTIASVTARNSGCSGGIQAAAGSIQVVNTRFPALIAVVPAALAVAGCGGGKSAAPSTSTPATTPPATTAPASNAPGALQGEAATAATGDIPDNQVFLVYHSPSGWSIKYPEGWAQSGGPNATVFRDKNNIVRVVVRPGSAPKPRGSSKRPVAEGRADHLRAVGALAWSPACDQGCLHHPEPAEPRHRQAPDTDRRPVLRRPRREGRDDRSRHAGRRRQRGCVPADEREPPVEVRSLYREPERQEQVEWGALELHDVFKIFRAGDTDVVALRGLDLRSRAGRAGGRSRPVGLGEDDPASPRGRAGPAVGRRGSRLGALARAEWTTPSSPTTGPESWPSSSRPGTSGRC